MRRGAHKGVLVLAFAFMLVLSSLSVVTANESKTNLLREREQLYHATDIEYTAKEEIKQDLKEVLRDVVEQRRQEIKELKEQREETFNHIKEAGGKRSYDYHLDHPERKIVLNVEEELVLDRKGEETIRRYLIHEGAKVKTDLQLRETSEEGNLRVELSDGRKIDVHILPEEVQSIARKELGSDNVSMELVEEDDGIGKKRLLYHAQTQKEGQFLGLIKTTIDVKTKIDPETGEIIDIDEPWWTFLLSE